MGLSGVTGEEYIRKIIQIEINIQKWKNYAIRNLMVKLSDELHDKDLEANLDLIAKGIEKNPRQVKRLINKYILVRYASLSAKRSFDSKKFFIGEILNERWPIFYQLLSNASFLEKLKPYIELQGEKERIFIEELERRKTEGKEKLSEFEETILLYKEDFELWDFLKVNEEFIMPSGESEVVAKEWDRYRRASESTTIPVPQRVGSVEKPLVFISYAAEDAAAAQRLYTDLSSAGLSPWIDRKNLLAGENWKTAIRKAIKESRFFIQLLSSKTVEIRGPSVENMRYALDIMKEYPESYIYLIPVRLDDCEIPLDLKDINYTDLFPDWDTGLNLILKAMNVSSST